MSETKGEISRDEKVAVAVVGTCLVPMCYAVRGVTLAHLWRWFVLPAFPHVPVIRAALWVGLLVLYGVARGPKPSSDKDGWELIGEMFSNGICYPAIGLLVGWIVQAVFL